MAYLLETRLTILLRERAGIPKWNTGPRLDPLVRLSPANTDTHFELTRIVVRRLSRHRTPGSRTVDVQGRIRGLEVIQEIREQRVERCSKSLREMSVLGNRHIKVPAREAVDPSGPTAIAVHSQHKSAEVVADRLRIGKRVHSQRIAALTARPGSTHAIVEGKVGDWARLDGILIRKDRTAVAFSERLAIAAIRDVDLQRQAALSSE